MIHFVEIEQKMLCIYYFLIKRKKLLGYLISSLYKFRNIYVTYILLHVRTQELARCSALRLNLRHFRNLLDLQLLPPYDFIIIEIRYQETILSSRVTFFD